MICGEFCFEDNGGSCGHGRNVGGNGGCGDGVNVGCGGGPYKTPTRPLQPIFTLKWLWWQLLWVGLLNSSVFVMGLVVVLVVVIWL